MKRNFGRWTMSHKLSHLPPTREIFLLISMSFGSCPEWWCGKPGSVKIQNHLCAAANSPAPQQARSHRPSVKTGCFYQGFFSYDTCQWVEEQSVYKKPFKKDFCCFLPFPSSGQEQIYLHGRFRVIAHILSSCHSLPPLSSPSTVLLHLTKNTHFPWSAHHWNTSLLSNPFPDVFLISGRIWLSPRNWLQGWYPRKLQSKT